MVDLENLESRVRVGLLGSSRLGLAVAIGLFLSACGSILPTQLDRADACQFHTDLTEGIARIEAALVSIDARQTDDAVRAAREAGQRADAAAIPFRLLVDQGLSRDDAVLLEAGINNVFQASVFLETEPEPNHPDLGNLRPVVESLRSLRDDLPRLLERYGVACD